MSQRVVSILNPMSEAALSVTLGRRVFLREVVLAVFLAVPLPLMVLAGLYLFVSIANPGIAIGTVVLVSLTAIPLLFYASLRLNAATLARERVFLGGSTGHISAPLKGPLLLRRSMVAGSVKSRVLAGMPGCLGFGAVFATLSFATGGGLFMPLHVPLGALFLVQLGIISQLLTSPDGPHSRQ